MPLKHRAPISQIFFFLRVYFYSFYVIFKKTKTKTKTHTHKKERMKASSNLSLRRRELLERLIDLSTATFDEQVLIVTNCMTPRSRRWRRSCCRCLMFASLTARRRFRTFCATLCSG
ncbi:hypothetical protein TCDM_02510 [Trypanosoma cruzi Dm28c]|uniref:Uncharacterized protein n=1 Tax=Trypanosoma cruzi Dm28c TaxID=1416333 RepID=V5BRJ2_TRYCR|nr:hypothetical protein TCDM_02510 [Trypanosoma cruzi Dm28c]